MIIALVKLLKLTVLLLALAGLADQGNRLLDVDPFSVEAGGHLLTITCITAVAAVVLYWFPSPKKSAEDGEGGEDQ